MSDWTSEQAWQDALQNQRSLLRQMRSGVLPGGTRALAETEQRIARIFAQGDPEWQERDDPRRLPLP